MPLSNARINIDVGRSPSKTVMDSKLRWPRQPGAIASNFDDEHGSSEKAAEPQYRAGYDVW